MYWLENLVATNIIIVDIGHDSFIAGKSNTINIFLSKDGEETLVLQIRREILPSFISFTLFEISSANRKI